MDGVKYGTIVADPPWWYSSNVGITTASRNRESLPGAAEQYDTMRNAEILAMPVANVAADDAHLYLWVTNPRLYRSPVHDDGIGPIEIMEAWGFRYVTLLTWHKLGTMGMGFYFRGDTEHVLFGVRGKAPIAPELRVSNFFAAPKTGHSRKPDRFYEIVERVSPEPRLELFARRRRYGWDVLGDEAPEEAASQAHMDLVP